MGSWLYWCGVQMGTEGDGGSKLVILSLNLNTIIFKYLFVFLRWLHAGIYTTQQQAMP